MAKRKPNHLRLIRPVGAAALACMVLLAPPQGAIGQDAQPDAETTGSSQWEGLDKAALEAVARRLHAKLQAAEAELDLAKAEAEALKRELRETQVAIRDARKSLIDEAHEAAEERKSQEELDLVFTDPTEGEGDVPDGQATRGPATIELGPDGVLDFEHRNAPRDVAGNPIDLSRLGITRLPRGGKLYAIDIDGERVDLTDAWPKDLNDRTWWSMPGHAESYEVEPFGHIRVPWGSTRATVKQIPEYEVISEDAETIRCKGAPLEGFEATTFRFNEEGLLVAASCASTDRTGVIGPYISGPSSSRLFGAKWRSRESRAALGDDWKAGLNRGVCTVWQRDARGITLTSSEAQRTQRGRYALRVTYSWIRMEE